MKFTSLVVGIVLAQISLVALADVEVRFVESAPKDRFEVLNKGVCELNNLIIEIDLSSTNGHLIFDTTASGAGVEVFQPFERGKGDVFLISADSVRDGDKSLTVEIVKISVNQSVSFTIDVDDTLENGELGQIRVTGSEMQGGVVTLIDADTNNEKVVFDVNNLAVFKNNLCT